MSGDVSIFQLAQTNPNLYSIEYSMDAIFQKKAAYPYPQAKNIVFSLVITM